MGIKKEKTKVKLQEEAADVAWLTMLPTELLS
jgi:hypothetical protein